MMLELKAQNDLTMATCICSETLTIRFELELGSDVNCSDSQANLRGSRRGDKETSHKAHTAR
jgi:hypothetical protein